MKNFKIVDCCRKGLSEIGMVALLTLVSWIRGTLGLTGLVSKWETSTCNQILFSGVFFSSVRGLVLV